MNNMRVCGEPNNHGMASFDQPNRISGGYTK